MLTRVNHYDWLEKYLPGFFAKLGIDFDRYQGVISADGDKCDGYRDRFEAAGIPFEKGVAIYLLAGISPFSEESRDTTNGWVAPVDWVVANKDRFMPLFEDIATMIEGGQADVVRKAIDICLEKTLEFTVGDDKDRRKEKLLDISAEYYDISCNAISPNIRLWQYAFALAAAVKAGDAECSRVCLYCITEHFTDLSSPTKEFFGIK